MPVIYKITSPTGKIYVGQSWDWVKRKSVYKRKACKSQVKLYNSLVKHGYDNHVIEIVHELPEDTDQLTLNLYEDFYLQQHKDCGFLTMNVRSAGSNGKLSPETIEKMRKSLTGRKIDIESVQKMLETRIRNNYKLSEETKRKIGEKHKGKTISLETREKLREANLGKKLSTDTIEKIKKASSGRVFSEETKEKIRGSKVGKKNAMFGKSSHNSLKVINLETNRIFNSVREAEVESGINKGVLVNKLNGRTRNNTSFRYYNAYQ